MLPIFVLLINCVYSHDCGVLSPIQTSDCPPNNFSPSNPFFLPNCFNVNLNDLCEGDGECGTNHFLNNCQCGIFKCDVYRKISLTHFPTQLPSEAPTQFPTQPPTQLPTQVPSEVPSDIPSEVPSEAPTQYPTQVPSDIPTHVPTTDPCQTYDNNIICPLGTNYSDCSNPVIKAVCPYLCGGCISLSPTIPIIESSSQNQNKKSLTIITGTLTFIVIVLLIVAFIILRKKKENIYEEPINKKKNYCIQNEIYIPENKINDYDIGIESVYYNLASDDNYIQTELYEENDF